MKLSNQYVTFNNKFIRFTWNLVWLLLFYPSPRIFFKWRCFLLRCFGATLGVGVKPYPSVKIWAPWNLEMGDFSTLADHVDCYCVNKITIGSCSTISQYSFICTASHDYEDPIIHVSGHMPLITAPINIGKMVWIAADVFIAPGVSVGDGSVVLARSSVFKDIPPWSVMTGSPANFKRTRKILSLG